MALREELAATATAQSAVVGPAPANARGPVIEARHSPGYVYTSPEIFQREKEEIFMKDWLCVARVEQIAEPGDYMALRIMGEPIVVSRADDGTLNAFSNICSHRGVEVAAGEGNTREFSCPYHGWTYDLKGQLVGAAAMESTKGFDAAACGLPPVQIGVWRGWVFINFDADAIPLEDYVTPFEEDFGFLKMEECRLVNKFNYIAELDCNWKLVVENFIDFYHFGVIHASTLMKRMNSSDIPYYLRPRGGYLVFYDSGPQTPTGESLFGKMPWMQDKSDSFSISGLLSPNFNMFARVDNVRPLTIWPLSPTKTRLIIYPLLPKQHFEALPDLEERAAVYHHRLVATLEEDREMVQSLQNVMSSQRFRPGPMSRMEEGVHHIINYHLDRIFGEASSPSAA